MEDHGQQHNYNQEALLEEEFASGEAPAKQQRSTLREQNSRAQKRYRERQKEQATNMQSELEELRATATKAAETADDTSRLTAKLSILNNQLQSQQAQLAQLRQQQAIELNEQRCRQNEDSDKYAIDEAVTEISQLEHKWVNQFRRLAEEGADEEACERLVVASFHLFRELQQHLPTDGDQSHQPLWVTMLHRREASHLSCFTNVAQAEHWNKIAQRLQLQPVQRVELVEIRNAALKDLHPLFALRQEFRSQLQGMHTKWTVDMQSVCSAGAKLAVLKMSSEEVLKILQLVKDNFSKELEILESFNKQCFNKVLYPSDAVRCMSEDLPHPTYLLLLAHVYADAPVIA